MFLPCVFVCVNHAVWVVWNSSVTPIVTPSKRAASSIVSSVNICGDTDIGMSHQIRCSLERYAFRLTVCAEGMLQAVRNEIGSKHRQNFSAAHLAVFRFSSLIHRAHAVIHRFSQRIPSVKSSSGCVPFPHLRCKHRREWVPTVFQQAIIDCIGYRYRAHSCGRLGGFYVLCAAFNSRRHVLSHAFQNRCLSTTMR